MENCSTRWGATGKGPLFCQGREESRRPEGEVGTSTLSDQLESGCLFFCKNPGFGRGPGGLEVSGRCLILRGLKGKCRQTWGRPEDWAAAGDTGTVRHRPGWSCLGRSCPSQRPQLHCARQARGARRGPVGGLQALSHKEWLKWLPTGRGMAGRRDVTVGPGPSP